LIPKNNNNGVSVLVKDQGVGIPENDSTFNLMSQVMEDIQNNDVKSEFKELLQMMIMLFAMQTLTSSMGSGSSSDSEFVWF
jgi:hypothetical protein